jgi:osmotically-inducible protein OsmY
MGLSHRPADVKTKTAHSEEEDAMTHKLARFQVVALAVAVAIMMGLVGCRSTVSPGRQVDDAAITAKVKTKMAADGDINPFNIDVDTNEGVVTLQGRVKKEEARTRAEQLARETSGVKRVINLVKVGDQS